uniref:Uncharacterized protein n=1 Tax=Caenorhabditis japonica TaxID=281687 RepID=A0A8R1IMX8_CAEJA
MPVRRPVALNVTKAGRQYTQKSEQMPIDKMIRRRQCRFHQERSRRQFPNAPSDESQQIMFENIRYRSIDTPSRQRRVTPKVVQSTETDDTVQQNLCRTRRKPVRFQN